MKRLFPIIVLNLFLYYPTICLATNDIWLQDTNCIVLGANGYEVISKPGDLINYICSRNDKIINCSNTGVNSQISFDSKPSTITTYIILGETNEFVFWGATSHSGVILLNLTNKRYSVSSTHLSPEGHLITKQCVGIIKNY